LLASLSDEAARTLLAVLTFITPNGRIQPGADQLAEAVGVSEFTARERLRKLTEMTFEGVPLAHEITQATGRITCVLSDRLVHVTEAPAAPTEIVDLPMPATSHRDEIIAQSRAKYAHPRAEVERVVAEQLGYDVEDAADTPEGHLRRRVLALGMSREQARILFDRYPVDQIERQLDWLPYRRAKDPARFLIAAVEGQYEPPPLVRLDQAMAAREREEQVAGEGIGK
jgi:hypothetical protein